MRVRDIEDRDRVELFTLKGQIEVEKDAVGSEAVVVAPAAQTSGLTPASYFQSELSNFESLAAAGGTPITVTGNSSQNGIPSSTFTASINRQAASGQATVLVEPLAGQASSTELVFVADWAPQAVFGTESSLLTSIADCYGPEQGSLYQLVQTQAFNYMLPPAWSVPSGGEGQDSLCCRTTRGTSSPTSSGAKGRTSSSTRQRPRSTLTSPTWGSTRSPRSGVSLRPARTARRGT